jgi:hypothetical protein
VRQAAGEVPKRLGVDPDVLQDKCQGLTPETLKVPIFIGDRQSPVLS